MRVLLLYTEPDVAPFYLQAPIGILYLAAALDRRHQVRIHDANVDRQSVDSVVSEFNPDVIGVSFTTGCVQRSFGIAKKFGKQGRILIAGGYHPTFRSRDCIDGGFDIAARGEVEDTIADVLENLELTPNGINYKGTVVPPGYFFKDEKGNYTDTGVAKASDVDRFFTARHLLPEKYHNSYTHGVLVGSRGCCYSCVFCGSGRAGYRQRNPDKVIEELEYIVYKEGHKVIHFADDIFTHDPNWVREICRQILQKNINCEWSVNSRCDIPSENWDIFDLMSSAGCKFVLLGIESGHQDTLKASRKGLSVNKIIPIIQRIRAAGIRIRANLMFGLPSATYEDHLRSIDLMEEILPGQITASLCTPYPGTVLDEKSDVYGIKIKSPNWTSEFQRDYVGVSMERLSELIEYRDISIKEIYQVVDSLRARLRPYGYKSVSEDHNRGDRIIKTFLDRPKLLPIREDAAMR